MTPEEIQQWKADALKLEAWQRSIVRGTQYEPAGPNELSEESFRCPWCDGEGEVDGQRYDAKAVVPATLVAYGIGDGLKVAERWAEGSVSAVLELIAAWEQEKAIARTALRERDEAQKERDDALACVTAWSEKCLRETGQAK